MTKLFTCIFLLCTFTVYGQSITPSYRSIHTTSLDFDSIIKTHCTTLTSSSYFVITYPTVGASTSWIPQFLDAYNSIKDREEEIVLVLYNSGGYSPNDIPQFFQQIAGLSKAEYEALHVIINDDVYNTITAKRYLVRLQYYFRGHLYYDNAEKWHKSKTVLFPKEHVTLNTTNNIKLNKPDSTLIRLKDPMYVRDKNNLLVLSDAKNSLLNVDISTGKVEPLLNISSIYKASQLFCKYIVPHDTGRCNYAVSKEKSVNATQRKTISVDGVIPIDQQTALLVVNIEVLEKNTEKYEFKNDEGQATTFDIGQPVLNLYTLTASFNYFSGALSFKVMNEIESSDNHDYYIMLENGAMTTKTDITCAALDYGTSDSTTISIVKLAVNDSSLIPSLATEPQGIFDPKLDLFYTKTFLYPFAGQTYFSFNCSPNIYLLGRDKTQSKFIGNGEAPFTKEQYPQYLEDTTKTFVNFRVHTIQPILDGEFLCAYINYKNMPMLEIKNRMLKTVDIIDLSTNKDFVDYNSCTFREDILIYNDRIYFKTIRDNNLFLTSYEIVKNAK